MAQIAFSVSSFIDTSAAALDSAALTYQRAFIVEQGIDTSSALLSGLTLQRAFVSHAYVDQSLPQALARLSQAFSLDAAVSRSSAAATFNWQHAASGFADLERDRIEADFSTYSQARIDSYLDQSRLGAKPDYLRSLQVQSFVDSSEVQVEEWTRLLLSDPPQGAAYVQQNGVDVPLTGYEFQRNSVYALNVQVYWERLSLAGTSLDLIVRRGAFDTKPFFIKSTSDGSIFVKSLKNVGETEKREYLAQVTIRPSDWVELTGRSTTLYYEVVLRDSLNESYSLEKGAFKCA